MAARSMCRARDVRRPAHRVVARRHGAGIVDRTCAAEQTGGVGRCSNAFCADTLVRGHGPQTESTMYIGGGMFLLIVLLLVFVF